MSCFQYISTFYLLYLALLLVLCIYCGIQDKNLHRLIDIILILLSIFMDMHIAGTRRIELKSGNRATTNL